MSWKINRNPFFPNLDHRQRSILNMGKETVCLSELRSWRRERKNWNFPKIRIRQTVSHQGIKHVKASTRYWNKENGEISGISSLKTARESYRAHLTKIIDGDDLTLMRSNLTFQPGDRSPSSPAPNSRPAGISPWQRILPRCTDNTRTLKRSWHRVLSK